MITHAAIWINDTIYALPSPYRHHNIFQLITNRDYNGFEIQGFLEKRMNPLHQVAHTYAGSVVAPFDVPDSDHHFVFLDRKQAFKTATTEGQIARNPDPKLYQGDELFSEDLW